MFEFFPSLRKRFFVKRCSLIFLRRPQTDKRRLDNLAGLQVFKSPLLRDCGQQIKLLVKNLLLIWRGHRPGFIIIEIKPSPLRHIDAIHYRAEGKLQLGQQHSPAAFKHKRLAARLPTLFFGDNPICHRPQAAAPERLMRWPRHLRAQQSF